MSRKGFGVVIITAVFSLFTVSFLFGQQEPTTELAIPFEGEINADAVNVRTDSTVSSQLICNLNRGDAVKVVGALYDWYKIQLPKVAPAYIKKELVAPVDDKTIRVIKEKVNIRLAATTSSFVLGKAKKDEILRVVADEGGWFRIEPNSTSYGWVHKKFVHPFRTGMSGPAQSPVPPADTLPQEPMQQITLKGVIQPYGRVFKRIATHKLITQVTVPCPDLSGQNCLQEKVYLLRGSRKDLNALNYQGVSVLGRVTGEIEHKYPVIEVIKIELLE